MIMADSKKIQKEEVNEDLKAEDNKKKSKKEQNYKEELKKKEEEFNKKIEEVEGKLAKEKDDYVRWQSSRHSADAVRKTGSTLYPQRLLTP